VVSKLKLVAVVAVFKRLLFRNVLKVKELGVREAKVMAPVLSRLSA
jgi:hypothetical protein